MKKVKFLVIVGVLMLFVWSNHCGVSANVISGDFEYSEISDGTIAIVDYTGTDKTINIPSEIDSKKVSTIERYFLYRCNMTVEHIIIQEGITTIYTETFMNCPKLKSILIPDSVNSIDEISPNWVVIAPPFSFTSASIIIYANPNSYAKKYLLTKGWHFCCINHQNIISVPAIAPTDTKMGKTAGTMCSDCGSIISGCEFVVKTSTEPKKSSIVVISGSSFKILKNNTVEYLGIKKDKKSLTIPATVIVSGKKYKVTSVAKNAFKNNKKIKKVKIGSNIKKVNTGAFKGCKNLKTIIIKSSILKTIGKNAFKGINSKAKIRVPAKKLKSYKKLFKKSKLKSTVKIVKR